MRANAAFEKPSSATPPSQRITAGVLSSRLNSARSSKSQVRRRRRSVSAIMSAMDEPGGVERVVGEDPGRSGALEGEQGLEDQGVAVPCPGGGRGLDHRILAAHLVGEGRDSKRVLHAGYDVEIGKAGLHHHEVGA